MKLMDNLRLLQVRFCKNMLSAIVKKSPNLRWLNIHFSPKHIDSTRFINQFTVKFFIDTLQNLQNLRCLVLSNCNFSRPISCEYLNMMSLRELSFSNCEQLDKFLIGINKLFNLCFYNCEDLKGTSIHIANLLALENLEFNRCPHFKTIPESLENLTNLKILRMYDCRALEEFHVGVSNLLELESLTSQDVGH